jgi:hypothetical protein
MKHGGGGLGEWCWKSLRAAVGELEAVDFDCGNVVLIVVKKEGGGELENWRENGERGRERGEEGRGGEREERVVGG